MPPKRDKLMEEINRHARRANKKNTNPEVIRIITDIDGLIEELNEFKSEINANDPLPQIENNLSVIEKYFVTIAQDIRKLINSETYKNYLKIDK